MASDRNQAHDSQQNVAHSDTVEVRRAALDELLHLHVARAIDRLPDANAANPELAHCVCRLQTGVLPPVCCSAMTSTVAGAWAKPERTLNPRRTSAALPMQWGGMDALLPKARYPAHGTASHLGMVPWRGHRVLKMHADFVSVHRCVLVKLADVDDSNLSVTGNLRRTR